MLARKFAIGAAVLLMPFAAVACSDDSTGDLDVGDMSKELQDAGFEKEAADCSASKLKEADITKEEIDSFNETQDLDSETGQQFLSIFTECGAIPG